MKQLLKLFIQGLCIFFVIFSISLIWIAENNYHNAQKEAENSKDKALILQQYGFKEPKENYTGWEKFSAVWE